MSLSLANADPDNPESTELVVQKGNLGDELYVLANSGNRLLKSIAKRVHERDIAEAELRKATESLEERIEERTTELAEQIEAAQAASKAKHEFLATMSHEIRTPMTGVMGIADMLLDETIKPETREKVVLIKEETQSLLSIINDILDLSKIDAGKLKFENIDYHLRYELDKTIKIAKRYARGKPLQIICNVSENVPNDLHGDPTRLRQVLINLLGNAVKFTEKGHVSLEAHRETSSNSQAWLVLSVSDTGIGIPADRVDELFNEFTQADASISRRYEGTGLGLAISKRLIEHMTGTINLTSIEGEGSSFEVRLPLIEAKGEMEAETALEPVIDYETVRPLHILAVDDNFLNRRIIESILVKFGHKITFAHNGLEAVEQLSACILENGKGAINSDLASPIRPDLVLMDIRMPEMSGPEATQKIRALNGDIANIPIIALSADVIEDHVQEYYEVGMNSFVPKPIDYITLLGEINAVMKQEVHRPILKSQSVENISKIQQKA